MAKSELELLQENNELLRGVLSSPRPSSSASSAPSAGSGPDWNPLTTAAKLAAGTIDLLGKNSGYAATGIEALSRVTGMIPGVGDAMSKMTSVAGEHLIAGTKNLQKSMDVGNLQQDVGQLTYNVAKSRSTMDEWNASTLRGSDAMTSLAPVVTRGVNNFATLSEELQQSKIGETMRQAGFSNKEMNDVLLVTAKNTKNLNMQDAASRQQLINSAGELALKIQDVSAATGQSKAAILDKLEAEKKDAQLVIARQNMEPAQRAAFDNFRVSLNKLGPDAQELSKAFQTGGIRTPEQRAIFSAMGNLGPELQRVQKMQMEAGKDPTKKAAADAAQRNFEAKYFDYLRSKGVENRVNVDRSAAGDALRRMVIAGQEAGAGIQAGKQETPKATGAQVIAGQQRETALAIQGRDATGKRIAEAQPYRTVVGTEQAGKDIAAGAGLKVKELNTEINSTTGAFTKLNSALKDIIAPRTTEQAAKVVEKPVEIAGEAIKKLAPKDKQPGSTSKMPEGYKGAASRASGSLGSVGKLIEDWGTESKVKLHGKEGVITESQLNDIIMLAKESSVKDVAVSNQGTKQLLDTFSTKMSPSYSTKANTSPNISELFATAKQTSSQEKVKEKPEPAVTKTTDISSLIRSKELADQGVAQRKAQELAIANKNGSSIKKPQTAFDTSKLKPPTFEMPKMPSLNTATITNQLQGTFNQIGQMQNSVTSKLAESKSTTPTMGNLENLITKLSDTRPKDVKSEKSSSTTATAKEETESMSEITKQLIGLNMRMERLIAEVSNSATKQVKATKGLSGNRIAG